MKKFGLLFVVVLSLTFSSQLSAQNVSPHFSELKGMQDTQGNTHLLYRIYSYQQGLNYQSGSNSIYDLVPGASIDTIYFYDHFSCGPYMDYGISILDYDYWDNDLTKYIISGNFVTCLEPAPFISRFDSVNLYLDWFDFTGDIYISKQNDSLVFGLPNLISYDGGFNWDTIPPGHQIVSVAEYDDQTYFCIDAPIGYSAVIFKSTDAGNTYTMVDTGGTDWGPKFYYDSDVNHIYRTFVSNYPTRLLKGSSDQGNAFTWQTLYEADNDILISLDESQSGAIYLADGNKIMFSSDYGNTFNLFKELDKRIIGIYKEPNSDKLYAATKYKLYEMTNNSLTVIKSLPIPSEALEFYPLQIGNKWFYERFDYSIDWNTGNTIIDTSYFQRRVIGLENKPNGKKYYKIDDYNFYEKLKIENFERIDSSTGIVYRYDETLDSTNYECVIDDLMLEQGNIFNTSRLYPGYNPIGMIFENEDYFNDLGSYRKRNGFSGGAFGAEYYSLTQGIGLDSVFVSLIDAFDAQIDIKGCVIDGIVYGDTTLTDIDDDDNGIPTSYKLEQNFPNPFNPATKITWQSPVSGKQTLKVYDVLGNEVATLVDEFRNSGIYEVDFDASKLSSGVYFYQLKAGDFISTKKMILIK